MSETDNDRMREILGETLAMPAQERAAYLDQRCDGAPDLRAEIERRLASRSGDPTLEDPAAAPGAPPQSGQGDGASRYIGSYRILETLGEGGMGIVYKAEQMNPRRIVALKIVRPAAFTPRRMRRFELEAEVLGRLQHPGIARIYEAGVAADPGGTQQPFFAMEFISGLTLLESVQSRALDIPQRLELLLKICDAVQYAHQKGIIHRDLKPGNILVDDEGQPKILDFGVARLTESDLQAVTVQTDVGQLIGTLPYMSPEQAGGESAELDTRSDVYALGVIAYELLAGRRPYSLDRRSLAEAVRIIREEEPTSLRSFNRRLGGDLETIVGKALAKEKERRYASVSDLAGDIRRHLKDEPIAARPPGTWYRAGKFARRNKAVVAGVAVVFLTLSVGMATTTIQWKQARAAEQQALRNARQAVENADRAERNAAAARNQQLEADRQRREAVKQERIAMAVIGFLRKMLTGADPDRSLGEKVTVLQALTAATREIDQGSLKGQPLVEAAVRDAIGTALLSLGSFVQAEDHLRKALLLRRRNLPGQHADIACTLNDLAGALREQNKLDEAEKLYREALPIYREALPADDPAIPVAIQNLATLLAERNRWAEAEPLYREALELQRKILPPDAPEIAMGLADIAGVLRRQGKPADADALYREALARLRKALPGAHPHLAVVLGNFAACLFEQGQWEQAERLYREALGIYRKTHPPVHPEITLALHNLAVTLREQQKWEESEARFREALEIRRKTLAPGHRDTVVLLYDLSVLMSRRGQFAQAEALLREALDIRRKSLAPGHPNIAMCIRNLAQCLHRQGKLTEAETLYREALAIFRKRLSPGHEATVECLLNLATLLDKAGQWTEAEALLREALECQAKRQGPSTPDGVAALLANVLDSLGRRDEAAALRKQYGLPPAPATRAATPASAPTTRPATSISRNHGRGDSGGPANVRSQRPVRPGPFPVAVERSTDVLTSLPDVRS